MQIDLTPTLIEMYRETFEGAVRPNWCWIVSGAPEASVFGSLAGLDAHAAYAEPLPGRKSIAAHATHLKFTLELTYRRLQGENRPPTGRAASSRAQQVRRHGHNCSRTCEPRMTPSWPTLIASATSPSRRGNPSKWPASSP